MSSYFVALILSYTLYWIVVWFAIFPSMLNGYCIINEFKIPAETHCEVSAAFDIWIVLIFKVCHEVVEPYLPTAVHPIAHHFFIKECTDVAQFTGKTTSSGTRKASEIKMGSCLSNH